MTRADAGFVPTLFINNGGFSSQRIHQCQARSKDQSLTHGCALRTMCREIALIDGAEATEVATALTSVIVNRHSNAE